MTQPYPIVGVQGTGCHPRVEIRDLQKNPIQFSLFIRALTKLQDMKSDEDMKKPNSWWQMGGIHGLPYKPWSGDPKGPQVRATTGDEWGGYCYHGSALFPPWHRVLLLMVEQALVNEAIAVARELEAKDSAARTEKWLEYAKALRFPFWDWTRPETAQEGVLKVCRETVITIVNPGGSSYQVPNPLNHYKYASNTGTSPGIEYMGKWTRTYRWVNDQSNPTKEMYDEAAKAFSQEGRKPLKLGNWPEITIQHPVNWLRERVASLFTYDLTVSDPSEGPNMWAYFASTGPESGTKVDNPMSVMPASIEDSHNTVHVDVGGNGSMSTNEYAAFDPIFFLHHSNIDRIYAFWEYLYPEYWIGNGWKDSKTGQTVSFDTESGTFYQTKKATIDHATELHPFRKKDSNYWTSDDARGLLSTSMVNKYYTYPPITDPKTGVKIQVDVPYDVNNLALRQQFRQALYREWGLDLHTIAHKHLNLPIKLPFLELLFKQVGGLLHLRQFIVVGRLPEFAFSGSYRLELYLLPKVLQLASGAIKQVSGALQQVMGFAGLGIVQQGVQAIEETFTHVVNNITVLGRSAPDRCAACKERRATGSYVRGYMHLDPNVILLLIASLDLTPLASITKVDHLVTLIQGSLGVRLIKPDGTKLAAADPDTPTHHSPLEETRRPKLTLHSHIIKFHQTDHSVPIQFGEQTTHGAFGETHGWKAL